MVEQAYYSGKLAFDKESRKSSFNKYETYDAIVDALRAYDNLSGEPQLLIDYMYRFHKHDD
jgi:hypothetical protein